MGSSGGPGRGRVELYLEGARPGGVLPRRRGDLSAPPSTPGGRHPLPALEDFTRAAGAAGIGPGVFVVAYDQGMNGGAARLWWLLRHCGHDDVAVLDGGIEAWMGPLRAGEEEIEPVEFVARPREDDTIEADELESRLEDDLLTIVDARLPERYRGEVEPIDPVAGHIPGARNAPYPDELPADLLEADEIVAYCGSGITAAVVLLRLTRPGATTRSSIPARGATGSAAGCPSRPARRGRSRPRRRTRARRAPRGSARRRARRLRGPGRRGRSSRTTVISSGLSRPGASPSRMCPSSVTSSRVIDPASTARLMSPLWLACSHSSTTTRTRVSSSTAISAFPGPSAPIRLTCWPGSAGKARSSIPARGATGAAAAPSGRDRLAAHRRFSDEREGGPGLWSPSRTVCRHASAAQTSVVVPPL